MQRCSIILKVGYSCDTSLLLESLDQAASRGIVSVTGTVSLEFGLDLLREDLAELDAPLVEGIDVPDCALGESEVFVVGNQSTESTGRDLLSEDGGGGAVTHEGLVRDEI